MSEIRWILQQVTAAFEAGDYDKAEGLLHEVLSRESSFANVYNMLGVIAGHKDAPKKAVAIFRQTLSLNPDYREAQVNPAVTLADMGTYDQAAQAIGSLEQRETTGQTCGRALQLNRKHPLGCAYLTQATASGTSVE